MGNTSIPALGPASIFDRADGTSANLGGVATATGPVNKGGAIGINTANGNTPGTAGYVQFWQETSDSPEIESGEQSTIVHKFYCDYYTAQVFMIMYPRGTYLTDQFGNTSRVLSSRITPVSKAGFQAVLFTLTSEGQYPLFPNPPDEFDIETVELNPALEKHPRYNALTYKQRYWVRNADIVDSEDLASQYVKLLGNLSASADPGTLPSTITLQTSQSQEMLFKKHKGEDTFYLAGYKVTWSRYFWYPQILNPGGYIEDPVYGGGLPAYFWSTTGLPTGINIFGSTNLLNANLYPQTGSASGPPYGLSWLRQADTIHLNRTWWKLTSTWIGGPLGHWDNELYNRVLQPYQTNENQGAVLT